MNAPRPGPGAQMATSTSVRVVCRLRPEPGQAADVAVLADGKSVRVEGAHSVYLFGRALGPEASQADVFEATAADLADALERGYGAALLAYGQTGSGKTYSLVGGEEDEEGLLPRTARALLARAAAWEEGAVTISALEIYRDGLRDLLDPARSGSLAIRGVGQAPRVENLSEHLVSSWPEVARALARAYKTRTVGATDMNEVSSRSHALYFFRTRRRAGPAWRCPALIFADLAGSEDVGRSGASGERAAEACSTNLALAALGSVVAALTERPPRAHVPYRDSKLTQLLSAVLAGRSILRVLVTLRPGSARESLATLNFGQRALSITSVPEVADRLESLADLRAELVNKTDEAARLGGIVAEARADLERVRAEVAGARAREPPPCEACLARAAAQEADDSGAGPARCLEPDANLRQLDAANLELASARGAVSGLMDMLADSTEIIRELQAYNAELVTRITG